MKYLGIDWGERKIGLALGSSETGLALPHGVTEDIDYIKKLCNDEEIDVIIVGVPKRGEDGKWIIENGLKNFIEKLGKIENVKVELADERLTTKMAGKLNRELKGEDDAAAASLILQGYMDRILIGG